MEVAAADVAFCIVGSNCSICLISTCKIETWELASCYRYRYVRCRLFTVTMGAHAKFLNPHIAT